MKYFVKEGIPNVEDRDALNVISHVVHFVLNHFYHLYLNAFFKKMKQKSKRKWLCCCIFSSDLSVGFTFIYVLEWVNADTA